MQVFPKIVHTVCMIVIFFLVEGLVNNCPLHTIRNHHSFLSLNAYSIVLFRIDLVTTVFNSR
jgi:hypothetical protein